MKILVLRSTEASGQPLAAGEVAEVSEKDAQILIGMGKATDAPAPVCPPKKPVKRPNA